MRKSAELRKAEIVAAVLDLADRIGPDRVTTGAAAVGGGRQSGCPVPAFPDQGRDVACRGGSCRRGTGYGMGAGTGWD
jgi:hypothetical protein